MSSCLRNELKKESRMLLHSKIFFIMSAAKSERKFLTKMSYLTSYRHSESCWKRHINFQFVGVFDFFKINSSGRFITLCENHAIKIIGLSST